MALLTISALIQLEQTWPSLAETQIGSADAARQAGYVVFSMDYVQEMFNTIWSNVGSITSTALFLFLAVVGVHLVFSVVSQFGR